MSASRRVLDQRTVGVRRLACTNWTVSDVLVRDQRPGRRATWVVVRGLCNGTPDSSTEHSTLASARAEWGQK